MSPPRNVAYPPGRDVRPKPESSVEDPPTVRVSIVCRSSSEPDLLRTPPPRAELSLTASVAGEPCPDSAPVQVGDTIVGFELVEELGQGAFAKVFLAHQESLAGRPVALKVTLRPTKEAERLARLQHTNVVPVYSVHNAPPVQIICMPYLGRRTIADLIRAYRVGHSSCEQVGRKTAGTRQARTTELQESNTLPKSTSNSGLFRRPLELAPGDPDASIVGNPTAVLRIIGQLAAGLAHAHERGILHLDLKPANVLLADTGEPMLLDFNLSFDTTSSDRDLIGGTLPYMATEQLLDLRSRGHGKIDNRTDLYALGIMAFEMLTGHVPFPASYFADVNGLIAVRQKGPPALRKLNPNVTPAIEAIVSKLLAPKPEDRYQTADELRIDVERHLNDLPLVYARESSLRERFGKWRRRNPGVPTRLFAACLFGLALGLGGVAHFRAEASARAAATDRAKTIRTGLDQTRLDLVLPGDPAARARGISKAKEFLESYGLPDDPGWAKRNEVQRLSEQDRTHLASDLGELLLLVAQARWHEADGQPEPDQKEAAAAALKLNRAARGCFPPGSAPGLLERQAESLAAAAGQESEPITSRDEKARPDAREWFLDGTAHLMVGRYAAAVPLLERVLDDQQEHAAAQFCLAYCKQQLGEHKASLERYRMARALMPGDPRPSSHSGVVYALLRKPAEAEAEFSHAIKLDPAGWRAYSNRAVARLRLQRFAEAEQDLTTALEKDGAAIQIHLIRAEIRDLQRNAEGAASDRRIAANLTPKLEGDYLVRGWSRITPNPTGAIDDFKAALAMNPRSLQAMQNAAHVYADKLHDLPTALAMTTRAVELYPEYAPVRAGRAVVLARLGKRDQAHREIEKARLFADDPEVIYRAACVYSLTSITHKNDRTEALALLRKAFREGYRDLETFRTDKDLNPLRELPDFRKLEENAAIWAK